MENFDKKNNIQKYSKKEFFSRAKNQLLSSFLSASDEKMNNLLSDASLSRFDFLQMKFGDKWPITFLGLSVVLLWGVFMGTYSFVPAMSPLTRVIVGIGAGLGCATASRFGLMGLSTFIVKHSKKWGLQYKKYQIDECYKKLCEMLNKNKDLQKAIENEDIYAFGIEFKKIKEENDKILKLFAEIEEGATKLKKSEKNDELKSAIECEKMVIASATDSINFVEYQLENLAHEDMQKAKEVLNANSKTLSSSEIKQQTKNNSTEKSVIHEDEIVL